MGEGGHRRRDVETFVDALVDVRDDLSDRFVPQFETLKNGGLARAPVMKQGAQKTLGIVHRFAVPRPVDAVTAPAQPFERRHIGAHGAVRRRDHGGRPGHHMVAGEERLLLREREAKMVRRMTRRRHGHE